MLYIYEGISPTNTYLKVKPEAINLSSIGDGH